NRPRLFVPLKRIEEFELLGEPAHRPGEPARPGTERRITLLRVRTAIVAVVDVEDTFVRRASADVVRVAALAVPDRGLRGRERVLRDPVEERDLLIVLAHEDVPERVTYSQRPERADRIDEQGVRTVEAIDVPAAIRRTRPAGGLHRA